MSVVLSIYSENAYKEFVLPGIKNTETTILLRQEVFHLSKDLELKLENTDGSWAFSDETAQALIGFSEKHPQSLQNGDYFRYQQGGHVLLAIMVKISENRFISYKKYALNENSVTIGTDPECGIQYSFKYRGSQYITFHHAIISHTDDGLSITDKSKNGVFLNDVRIHGTAKLRFGDRIDIWGLNIVALGQYLAIRPDLNLQIDITKLHPCEPQYLEKSAPVEKIHYHRSPRTVDKLFKETISIEAPPAPQKMAEQPLYMVIGPSLTMALPMLMGSAMAVVGSSSGGVFMYTGIITAVSSALIGTMWALVNLRFNRSQSKKNENRRFTAYSDYLVKLAAEIRNKYEHNSKVLLDTYPAAAEMVAMGLKGEHLWERNLNHPDFLTYRLGLGDQPFQVEINVPAERFDLIEDSLREKPTLIRDNFSTLHNVPVCIDLRQERIVGLVGGPARAGAMELLRVLVAQIVTNNCYTDVKMAFVFLEDQGDDTSKWAYTRWFPHVWNESKRFRYVASSKAEASDVFYELATVLRARAEQAEKDSESIIYKPWYILVLEDDSILENEPVAKYLLDSKRNLGVTTLILADQAAELPNVCECVACFNKKTVELYHTREGRSAAGSIAADTVDLLQLEALSRHLANVEVKELEVGGEIPPSVSFFEMYGIEHPWELHVEERWKRNRSYENMRALIGQKSGNQPCYLDVHEKYHGPHGLVAGTTGSGKSETLQTYVLSLAANFSPYDVGLFIIDYKGGGMGNLFNGLPHVLGQISNLSGGQIRRAMVSIKSENQRRQRIFNENGVNNINLYTALVKNGEATVPIPHLFIIIDEFAELKREQPEFMRELISVAQVGRSLGVHLILATQKPAGTVDENIWSNSKFRLCLRVQDRQDSMDMLHKPDAAYLIGAGRGFLQVGNDEVFEQFQSGWSGAVYDENDAGSKQVLAKVLTDTGKTALTGSYAKRHRMEQYHIQWIDLISQCVDPGQVTDDVENICSKAFSEIRRLEIDYAENDYNTKLLSNMVLLLRRAQSEHIPAEKRSAWIIEHARQENLKLPERREKTQLDAMVDYLAKIAKSQGYEPLQPLWMAPLPEVLGLSELNISGGVFNGESWPVYESKWELKAPVGKCDDPANQAQLPVILNFSSGGNHALIGSTGVGKSTFTQTMVYSLLIRYDPNYLNVYILDFSNRMTEPFEHAPHVGGILYENDVEKVGKLFYLLSSILAERKQLFRGGSYAQYVMVNGVVCPIILLVIDNIANFREKTQEAFDEELMRLAREGAGYGIYLFITGMGFGISEIPNRLGDNLRTTLSLELADIYQYADVLRTTMPSVLPESDVRGRGLVNQDGVILEFQTALSIIADDDYDRIDKLRAIAESMSNVWKGAHARSIPYIPEKPTWADLESRIEMPALYDDPRYLPVGYNAETAGIYSIDLSRTYCYTVAGRRRTGKTNVLRLIMKSAKLKHAKMTVIECSGGALKNEAMTLDAEYCSTFEEIKDFIRRLAIEFRNRNSIKRELILTGADEEQIFRRMSQEPLQLVIISNLADFAKLVHGTQGREANLNGALANLLSRGFLFHIYFAADLDIEDRSAAGLEFFELFTKEKTGIYLGGNVAAQQLFDFSAMPFKEQTIIEKPGVGLVPPKDGDPYHRIILPIAKAKMD